MKNVTLAAALCLAATAGQAQDAEAGAEQFNRQCVSCHVVRDADGNTLAGRNGRAGPNLFAVTDALVAQQDGFRYGKGLQEAAEAGVVWSRDNFVAYVQDPTKWLRATLNDNRARSKMAYRVRKESEALDIYAYLGSLVPAAE